MSLTGFVARPLLSGMFIYGGLDAFRHPETKVPRAEKVAPGIAAAVGLPTDTVKLIKINGAVQVVAGAALALGVFPRVAALVLAGSLVPTTAAGHAFWDEEDPAARNAQRIQFLKNTAMFGGLLLAAADTGGRPSVRWRTRRAVAHTVEHTRELLPVG